MSSIRRPGSFFDDPQDSYFAFNPDPSSTTDHSLFQLPASGIDPTIPPRSPQGGDAGINGFNHDIHTAIFTPNPTNSEAGSV
jgi:hypothetical protein